MCAQSFSSSPRASVAAIVLAGGEGRRLARGEKALVELAGRTLLEHVIARVAPQVQALAISANRAFERYRQLTQLPLLADAADEQCQGPLAGIAQALDFFPQTDWVLTVPCDTPLLPLDLVDTLVAHAAPDSDVIYACDAERAHYTIALWRPNLAPRVHRALGSGERRVRGVIEQCRATAVRFEHSAEFINVNGDAELDAVAARLALAQR
ncbi:molybdenum cofactor guanylyltransferase MobA [Carnimonas bestiolae]|uniref:molybdenum cofactor guanylyltransferase MobA n=1 Tax=Carnimonas bestiolae TaxID=3402172 RepID=UPI003EDC1988